MGLYTINLSDEQIQELLDGERKWWECGRANVSIEVDEDVDHFTIRDDAEERGHKCGVKFPPETFEAVLDDPTESIGGWTAVEGHKVGGGEQVEVIFAHEDNPKHN